MFDYGVDGTWKAALHSQAKKKKIEKRHKPLFRFHQTPLYGPADNCFDFAMQ